MRVKKSYKLPAFEEGPIFRQTVIHFLCHRTCPQEIPDCSSIEMLTAGGQVGPCPAYMWSIYYYTVSKNSNLYDLKISKLAHALENFHIQNCARILIHSCKLDMTCLPRGSVRDFPHEKPIWPSWNPRQFYDSQKSAKCINKMVVVILAGNSSQLDNGHGRDCFTLVMDRVLYSKNSSIEQARELKNRVEVSSSYSALDVQLGHIFGKMLKTHVYGGDFH